jgi:DNA-binding transcriptional ArsR family regulator
VAAVPEVVGGELAVGRLMRVLSDPTRLAILRRLADGEATVTELIAAVGHPPQSRVSNHLACLRWCQLVSNERIGRHVRYRLIDWSVIALINQAAAVAAPHGDRLASCERLGPDWT